MTYRLSNRLFLENGPAVQAASARERRTKADAFYITEAAKLAAARQVSACELPVAA